MNELLGIDPESRKAKRSRRWVREYRAAIANVESGWGVDADGRPFLVNLAVGGKMRKSTRRTYKPKQKVEKASVESLRAIGHR